MRAHVLRNIWADFARFRLGVAWKLQDGPLVDIAMGFPVKGAVPGRRNVEEDTPRHASCSSSQCEAVRGPRAGIERDTGNLTLPLVQGSYDSIDIEILHQPYHFALVAFCLLEQLAASVSL